MKNIENNAGKVDYLFKDVLAELADLEEEVKNCVIESHQQIGDYVTADVNGEKKVARVEECKSNESCCMLCMFYKDRKNCMNFKCSKKTRIDKKSIYFKEVKVSELK